MSSINLRQHTARFLCRELRGIVVSAGLMSKTATVRVGGTKWNSILQKTFNCPRKLLVHDPNSSLRNGDVVAIHSGWKTSKRKKHVLKEILKPSGPPLEDRPPVLSEEELIGQWLSKRKAKEERRSARGTEDGFRIPAQEPDSAVGKAGRESGALETEI